MVFVIDKPPEPKGAVQGRGLFMDHKSLSAVVYILHSDCSLLLLVNTHGSFHCKQGSYVISKHVSLHCKQGCL